MMYPSALCWELAAARARQATGDETRNRWATKAAERFNEAVPVGTTVEYWLWDEPKTGERANASKGKTRSKAYNMGGTPVVMIQGTRGCWALSHLVPATTEPIE